MESISTYIEKELKVTWKRAWLPVLGKTRLLGFTFYDKKGDKGITYAELHVRWFGGTGNQITITFLLNLSKPEKHTSVTEPTGV